VAPALPSSLAQMPVIPFADGWKPTQASSHVREDEFMENEYLDDEFAEDAESPARSALRAVWVLVRRATIAAALVAGAFWLATRQDRWVPQTRAAAVSLFSGMDQIKTKVVPPPSPPPTVLVAAVATTSEQVPLLGVETIQLIMASAGRALEPVEVMRSAFAALERARPSLAQPTADELDALTSGLAAELTGPDQTWLGDYLARVRARAVTLRYEDTKALWLMSRAARRLPAERLQRLQEVMANAVALGLQPRHSPPAPARS
jgi:hypothetical protein